MLRPTLSGLLLVLLLAAAPAGAESLSVSAGGDPVAGLPNGVDYEYDTGGVQLGFQVIVRPAAGPPCAPTMPADEAAVGPSAGALYPTPAPLQLTGNGLGRVPFTFPDPGRVRICGWLYRTPDDVVAVAANEADVRAPATSLTVTAEEVGAAAGGADIHAHVTGSSEAAADLYVTVISAATGCPAAYEESADPALLDVVPHGVATRVTGGFDLRFEGRERLAYRRWRVCAFLQNGTTGATAIAVGTAVVDFVLKPAVLRRPRVREARGVLTCDARFKARPAAKSTHAWLRGGSAIPGATGRTLKVVKSLKGKTVACRATAANALGRTSATSRAIRVR